MRTAPSVTSPGPISTPKDSRSSVTPLDRRRTRSIHPQDRQERQGACGVRDHGRRQAGALAGSLGRAIAGRARREPKRVRPPDHWAVQSRGPPGASYTNVNLRRSKGYEGFAGSKDGKFLYGLLEGPLWDAEKKDVEKVDGKEASRILEFDVAAEKFTGRYWQYVFEQNGNAIGDFNMIDPTSGLIIERDNGEGTADKACPAGQRGENCFPDLAKFKRVYKVELSDPNVAKPVRKIAYIDLMKIKDPDKKARKPLNDGVLAFPFFTIENVDRVDETHIIVGNDNNLPFSSSRDPNKADDDEFMLLEVADFLKAK